MNNEMKLAGTYTVPKSNWSGENETVKVTVYNTFKMYDYNWAILEIIPVALDSGRVIGTYAKMRGDAWVDVDVILDLPANPSAKDVIGAAVKYIANYV